MTRQLRTATEKWPLGEMSRDAAECKASRCRAERRGFNACWVLKIIIPLPPPPASLLHEAFRPPTPEPRFYIVNRRVVGLDKEKHFYLCIAYLFALPSGGVIAGLP